MAQLDIHLIGGALYSYWPLDFSQGVDKEGDWKRSVEAMQDIAPVAKQYDINLGMEVLNRFENHIPEHRRRRRRFRKRSRHGQRESYA